jgi:hypothetical protein
MPKKGYPKHHKVRDRLPAEPLFTMFNDDLSYRQIGIQLGRTRRTLQEWKVKGIPFYEADKVACHIGVHPSHIWGEQWWQLTSAT